MRYALSKSTRLSKLVAIKGASKPIYDEYMKLSASERKEYDKVDFKTALFYIPKEQIDHARHVYSSYRFSLTRIILFCLLVFLIYGAIAALSLELLCFINTQLGA